MKKQYSILATLNQPQLTSDYLQEFKKIKFINSFNNYVFNEVANSPHLNLDLEFYEELCYDILLFLGNYQESPAQLSSYFLSKHSKTLKSKNGKLKYNEKFHFLLLETILNKITDAILPGRDLPLNPLDSSNLSSNNKFSFLFDFHCKFIKDFNPEKDKVFTAFFEKDYISQENSIDLKEQILKMDYNYQVKAANPISELNPTVNQQVKWTGENIELVELIKSLIQADKISGKNEKEIFKFFADLFNVEINQKQQLQTIKKRTTDQTPLLNILTDRMEKWTTKN